MTTISLAEKAASKGVTENFDIPIKANAQLSEKIYLNSELDYHDRRNISLVLQPNVIQTLKKQSPKVKK